MKIVRIYFSLICLMIFIEGYSQPIERPEIGKPMPGFTLDYVTHYKSSKVSLKDFRGKWLFLDFWSLTCSPCIRTFPHVSEWQQMFSDEAQFLMVGISERKYNTGIEEIYEKHARRKNLAIVMAYDSTLWERWDLHSVPHIYIIDPEGIVRFITDARDLSTGNLKKLFGGGQVSFFNIEKDLKRFDAVRASGGIRSSKERELYHSVVTEYNDERSNAGYSLDTFVKIPPEYWEDGFELAQIPLYGLYNLGYFGAWYLKYPFDSLYGKVNPYPILEMEDTSLFDRTWGVTRFTYNIKLPPWKVNKDNITRATREDMGRAFPYHCYREIRNMPAWKLIAQPGAAERLKTHGGIPYDSELERNISSGFTLRNATTKTFFQKITYYLGEKEHILFFDKTAVKDHIDIEFDADMTDMQSVIRELRKHGLDLIKAQEKMEVLVIRDVPKL